MVDESSAEAGAVPQQPGAAEQRGTGEAPAAEEPVPGNAAAESDAAAEDPTALQDQLAAAEAALEAAHDKTLRAQAEADNTRRRAAREMENARKFAVERLAGDLLPAIDGFERAVEAARAASETAAAEGVELSLKLLLGALEKAGVSVVDPLGAPFDPRFHEAISMVENAQVEPGSVTQVVQKGYVLNERVVRAAKVIVAKAPPAPAPPNAEATPPAEG